jgi:hypothetical protein
MRSIVARQRLARTAAAAVSLAVLAACAPKGPAAVDPARTGTDDGLSAATSGMLVISDGSTKVRVGGQTYTFPTTVTDAALSPDGSRIAFVDGDDNIATARLDGKDLVVLTKSLTNGVRSRPAWRGWLIVFAEKPTNGTSKLRQVSASFPAAAFGYWGDGTKYRSRFETPIGGEVDADLGWESGKDTGTSDGYAPSSAAAVAGVQGNDLAYQRDGAKGAEVYISDINSREPYYRFVDNGTEPALAPAGDKVAYVKGGQIWVRSRQGWQDGPATQVTFDAKSPTRLVFSPDGSRIAFSTPSDVESVATAVASGAGANPAKVESPTPGVPSYLGATRDKVIRVNGADPVATAIAVSQSRWPDNPQGGRLGRGIPSAAAILLAGTDNPDLMLAGAQLVDSGPLLLTAGATLDPRTAGEITRIFGTPQPDAQPRKTVTILGGTDSVPSSVDSAIKKLGYAVKRVKAATPVAMALIANDKPADAAVVLVVDGHDVASYASAVSDLGSNSTQTVLLTDGTTLPPSVRTYLNGVPKSVLIYGLGATAQTALGSWSKTRWTGLGDTPGAVTSKLLSSYGGRTRTLVLAPASSPGDMLAAIGVARDYGAPVIAVGAGGVDEQILAWARTASGQIDTVVVVDGNGAVGDDVVNKVTAAVSGPLSATGVTNPKAVLP